MRGDSVEEMVVKTLIGYPGGLITCFLKSVHHRFLVRIDFLRLRGRTREHKRHRYGGEVGNGVATIERYNLSAACCQTGRCRTFITVDRPMIIAGSLSDEQYHDGRIVALHTGDAETEIIEQLVLLLYIVSHSREVVAG